MNCLPCFNIIEDRQRSCAKWCFFISGLTFSTILFGITRSLLIFYVLVNASQTLHNKILSSILRAPVLFFYRNPIGKSDTRFLSEYVLLTHLIPDYIWYLKMEEMLRRKSPFIFYEKLHWYSFLPEKIWIGVCNLLFQFMCVCKDKWMFNLQDDSWIHL